MSSQKNPTREIGISSEGVWTRDAITTTSEKAPLQNMEFGKERNPTYTILTKKLDIHRTGKQEKSRKTCEAANSKFQFLDPPKAYGYPVVKHCCGTLTIVVQPPGTEK